MAGEERRESDLGRRADRLEWRLDALDAWRKDADRRLALVESEVETIEATRRLNEELARRGQVSDTTANAIAAAVANELAEERGHQPVATKLPLPARIGAFVAGALVVADAVRGLVPH